MAEKTSVVTRERFAKGFPYEDYLASIKTNKEMFEDNYAKSSVSDEDKKFFADLTKKHGPIKVLVLGEDWCPDVYTNLPIVKRIVESSDDIELRIFPRDENLDIMEQYLNNGNMSIPAVVFFDSNMNELGRWIERPKEATRLQTAIREELTKQGLSQDELRVEYRKRMAEAYQKYLRAETVREIREAVSK